MLDVLFVLVPFVWGWWLAGCPTKKDDPLAVKGAGLSFMFFGLSMLLRLMLLGRQMPANKSGGLMTTTGTVRYGLFMVVVGLIVLGLHAYFSKRE